MKMNFNAATGAMILICTLAFASCKKEGSSPSIPVSEAEAVTATEENTAADAEYDDIAEIGFSASADLEAEAAAQAEITGTRNGAGLGVGVRIFADLQFKLGTCTRIQVSPEDGSFPKTVTIDYGEGCICRDGKFRKGVVTLQYTAPLRRPGAELSISLRGYQVNRMHIEGKKIIKNLSSNGVFSYATQVENGKVSWPNGRGFTYEGSKVVTQLSGMNTITVRDDVFSVEGRNKTVFANGLSITRNTETALIKPVSCNWIVKGLLKVKINERVLFVDFGNGNCDNKATLKWANGEKEIELP